MPDPLEERVQRLEARAERLHHMAESAFRMNAILLGFVIDDCGVSAELAATRLRAHMDHVPQEESAGTKHLFLRLMLRMAEQQAAEARQLAEQRAKERPTWFRGMIDGGLED